MHYHQEEVKRGRGRQERRRNNLQAFMHTMNSEIFFIRVMNKLMIDRYLDTKITDQIIGFKRTVYNLGTRSIVNVSFFL